MSAKYPPGEIEVQERAGVRSMAERVGEETRERLRRFLEALAEWTRRFEEPVPHRRQARERTR